MTGDRAAFFWLQQAAGNAGNGQLGNEAPFTDGKGILELVPVEPALVQAKATTAHLKPRS